MPKAQASLLQAPELQASARPASRVHALHILRVLALPVGDVRHSCKERRWCKCQCQEDMQDVGSHLQTVQVIPYVIDAQACIASGHC